FFSSRRRHTRFSRDWSSDVCSSDLLTNEQRVELAEAAEILFFERRDTHGKMLTRAHEALQRSLVRGAIHLVGVDEHGQLVARFRSEERRVGKECRAEVQRAESAEKH